MKVDISFLKRGWLEAEAPEDFPTWEVNKRMEWATKELTKLTDNVLLDALSDYTPEHVVNMGDRFIKEGLQAEMIMYDDPKDPDRGNRITSEVWESAYSDERVFYEDVD